MEQRAGRTAAKRPHKKSKNGCRTCRTRRVKCDEVHPLCGPCRKHCICCYYDRPDPNVKARQLTRSPSSTTSSSAIDLISQTSAEPSFNSNFLRPPPWFGCPDKRLLDLQLMNFYTYVNTTSKLDIDARIRHVWAYDIPQKALKCDYLMFAVLSYSAQYIHIHNPDDVYIGQIAHSYFGKAVRSLSRKVTQVDEENAEYVFAASLLIALQAALLWLDPCSRKEGYQLPIQWLRMGRGVGSILRAGVPAIRNSSMSVMLEIPTARNQKVCGQQMMAELRGSLTNSDDTPDVMAMRKALIYLKCVYQAIQTETVSFCRRKLLMFPAVLDETFFEMLLSQDPRALIVLAFYFAAMKVAEGHWWYDGRPKHEITGIAGLLEDPWRERISWPLELVEGDNTAIPDWAMISEAIPLRLTKCEA